MVSTIITEELYDLNHCHRVTSFLTLTVYDYENHKDEHSDTYNFLVNDDYQMTSAIVNFTIYAAAIVTLCCLSRKYHRYEYTQI